jgi:hypothetical protein
MLLQNRTSNDPPETDQFVDERDFSYSAGMLMLGFSPKLPVVDEEGFWVDEGFVRLGQILGRSRLMETKVILPDAKHFPDAYDRTEAAAETLFQRVCNYMQVDQERIKLEIFPDETEELSETSHWGIAPGRHADGLHIRDEDAEEDRVVIALRSTLLKDPFVLVATVAHELGHVILLDGGHMDRSTPDHEPMTDLLTVFLGFGMFTANSAARFKQYDHAGWHGWSMRRLGYLPQEVYGYALARFAAERGLFDRNPARAVTAVVRTESSLSLLITCSNAGTAFIPSIRASAVTAACLSEGCSSVASICFSTKVAD